MRDGNFDTDNHRCLLKSVHWWKNISKMKKYNKALVIGKFQPLHKGHLTLINFATTQAKSVTVCVTGHNSEIIPLDKRILWAVETFENNDYVDVQGLSYNPTQLNESSVSDVDSSIQWAEYLKANLEGFSSIDVIIGSEIYVKYMADYLGIGYLIYDEHRVNLPISATDIKNDILRYWDYLTPAVKRSYVQHICICGSECTGKSTVCNRLGEELDFVTVIPEIGRCLVGKSALCGIDSLEKIFSIHNELLVAVKYDPPTPIILWDTDNITTLSYLTFLNTSNNNLIAQVVGERKVVLADKYFFFESNINFYDDGTRFDQSQAKMLSEHHKYMYSRHGIIPEQISADNRCEVIRDYILQKIEKLKTTFRPK